MSNSAETNRAYEDLKAAGYDVTKEEVKEALHSARDDYGRDDLKDPKKWWEEHRPKGQQRWQEHLEKEEKDRERNEDSSSSGCYIASASLQGEMPIEVLEPLKKWRYSVLEKTSFGNRLSSYYRRTAPQLAKEIAKMPWVSAFLRETIVKPAIRLANEPSYLSRNIALYSLFLIGLSMAEIIKVLRK